MKRSQVEVDWIETFTGVKFYPLRPRTSDIRFLDIAHALSNLCRFTGHCSSFYSVAQHSVLCVRLATKLKNVGSLRELLFHDASEAYISDISRPLKKGMPEYREIEERLEAAIALRFNLLYPWKQSVKDIDNMMLYFEGYNLEFKNLDAWNFPIVPKFSFEIVPWSPAHAEIEFSRCFTELFPNESI